MFFFFSLLIVSFVSLEENFPQETNKKKQEENFFFFGEKNFFFFLVPLSFLCKEKKYKKSFVIFRFTLCDVLKQPDFGAKTTRWRICLV